MWRFSFAFTEAWHAEIEITASWVGASNSDGWSDISRADIADIFDSSFSTTRRCFLANDAHGLDVSLSLVGALFLLRLCEVKWSEVCSRRGRYEMVFIETVAKLKCSSSSLLFWSGTRWCWYCSQLSPSSWLQDVSLSWQWFLGIEAIPIHIYLVLVLHDVVLWNLLSKCLIKTSEEFFSGTQPPKWEIIYTTTTTNLTFSLPFPWKICHWDKTYWYHHHHCWLLLLLSLPHRP